MTGNANSKSECSKSETYLPGISTVHARVISIDEGFGELLSINLNGFGLQSFGFRIL